MGSGQKLGEIEAGETVIRMYYVRKNPFNRIKNRKNRETAKCIRIMI